MGGFRPVPVVEKSYQRSTPAPPNPSTIPRETPLEFDLPAAPVTAVLGPEGRLPARTEQQ